MSRPVEVTREIEADNYSEIIDVRSPAEFKEDHIPGAINLPVLNDEERSRVGTIYKQVNPFQAKKLGAALVSANISRAIEKNLIDRDKDYQPLIYCWRGGQRSMSMATILSRIGWKTTILDGGYKTYRAGVRKAIEEKCSQLDLMVISGLTGTGKTEILKQLYSRGEQVIDLEGLANHRGSLLGAEPDQPQPSQKYFESLLVQHISGFTPSKMTWIESESNKIGNIHCPESLWLKMKTAKTIEITADMNERIKYLLAQYPQLTESPELLKAKINPLNHHYGKKQIQAWHKMIDHKQWNEFVSSILENHYDPSYQRSISNNERTMAGKFNLPTINNTDIEKLVEQLLTKK